MFVIIVIHAYFIHISNFENRSLIGEDMDRGKVPRFLWPNLYASAV